MGEKERAQALHAVMVLSLEVGHRGGLAAPIVAQAQKVLDVNDKHREEAESHIRSARNGGDWQGQRGNVVRQAMKRVIDAIEYGDLPPGRKSKEFRRLVDRAKKVLEKAGERSDYMGEGVTTPSIMDDIDPTPQRQVQPAAAVGDANLLASLLDDTEEGGGDDSLIATLMDDGEEEDETAAMDASGQGLKLAPVAGGTEPMSHMDGEGDAAPAEVHEMEPTVEQTSTLTAAAQAEQMEVGGDDPASSDEEDAANQLLALQQQVAELTKAIKHEEEVEEFIDEETLEEDYIDEQVPETRMRRTRRAPAIAPAAAGSTTTRAPSSRASPSRRAMAAAPAASAKSRRTQVEEEEEEEEEEEVRRSSTLDTYRLLLETVWVDDLLDPAEVDLLRRKRVELGIDFETHLKMTREMLGGLD